MVYPVLVTVLSVYAFFVCIPAVFMLIGLLHSIYHERRDHDLRKRAANLNVDHNC